MHIIRRMLIMESRMFIDLSQRLWDADVHVDPVDVERIILEYTKLRIEYLRKYGKFSEEGLGFWQIARRRMPKVNNPKLEFTAKVRAYLDNDLKKEFLNKFNSSDYNVIDDEEEV